MGLRDQRASGAAGPQQRVLQSRNVAAPGRDGGSARVRARRLAARVALRDGARCLHAGAAAVPAHARVRAPAGVLEAAARARPSAGGVPVHGRVPADFHRVLGDADRGRHGVHGAGVPAHAAGVRQVRRAGRDAHLHLAPERPGVLRERGVRDPVRVDTRRAPEQDDLHRRNPRRPELSRVLPHLQPRGLSRLHRLRTDARLQFADADRRRHCVLLLCLDLEARRFGPPLDGNRQLHATVTRCRPTVRR